MFPRWIQRCIESGIATIWRRADGTPARPEHGGEYIDPHAPDHVQGPRLGAAVKRAQPKAKK